MSDKPLYLFPTHCGRLGELCPTYYVRPGVSDETCSTNPCICDRPIVCPIGKIVSYPSNPTKHAQQTIMSDPLCSTNVCVLQTVMSNSLWKTNSYGRQTIVIGYDRPIVSNKQLYPTHCVRQAIVKIMFDPLCLTNRFCVSLWLCAYFDCANRNKKSCVGDVFRLTLLTISKPDASFLFRARQFILSKGQQGYLHVTTEGCLQIWGKAHCSMRAVKMSGSCTN